MNLTDQLAAALGCALDHMDAAHPDAVSARAALAAYDAQQGEPKLPAISDQLCADILCTALEGGIGYWAIATELEMTTDEENYISCVLEDAEGDDDWSHAVDYDAMRCGIKLLLASDAKIRADTKRDVELAISNNDAGYIDIEGADAIIQFACFGEIVYG